MQQLLCRPTITCIWYSNLPSSHLASLWNVLCLWLCKFVFHYDEFLTTRLHLFYNPSSVFDTLRFAIVFIQAPSWVIYLMDFCHLSLTLHCKDRIGYGNWFFPLLVSDTATSQDIASRPHLYFYPIILPPTLSALITGFFPLPSTSCPSPYQPPITSHKHPSWTWPRLRIGLDFWLRLRVGLTLA